MKRGGFTLIEMAIVLVILGLLVGGVLVGKTIVRQGQLRSVSSTYQQFNTAFLQFSDEFRALPGDFNKAADYWGTAAAGAACLTTASTGTETCNGNGDGTVAISANSNEPFRFWQHLANAGLITGNYTGVPDGSTNISATSKNSPAGRLPGSVWYAFSVGNLSGNATYFDGNYNNALTFGGVTTNAAPTQPLLTAAEAFGVDTKLDDGKPGRGRVRSQWPTCTDAASSADGATASYNQRTTDPRCRLVVTNLALPIEEVAPGS